MDDDSSVCTSEVADNPFTMNSAVLADNSAGVESDRDIRDEYQLETQEADRVYGHPEIWITLVKLCNFRICIYLNRKETRFI